MMMTTWIHQEVANPNLRWTLCSGSVALEEGGAPEEVYFVTATSPAGVVYRHFHVFLDQDEADRMADRIVAGGPGWAGPVGDAQWSLYDYPAAAE